MTSGNDAQYGRQIDEFLMARITKLEASIDEIRKDLSQFSAKLDGISASQEKSKPSIDAMNGILGAGGILKWAVSTVVIVCMGFAAVMTAMETYQKWFVK